MKRIVIADAGPIFSLATIDKLYLLEELFDEVKIPVAVWEEITLNKETQLYDRIVAFFKNRVIAITGFNELLFIMDYGESESVVLYKELDASFLLIDDKKARNIAESLGVKCIGTIGLLSNAKTKGKIENLKQLFEIFLDNKRFYSIKLLNTILKLHNEKKI